jgi:hypothetical protein
VAAVNGIRSGKPGAEGLEAIFGSTVEHPQPSRDIGVLLAILQKRLIRASMVPLREPLPPEEPLLESFLRLWPYVDADHGQAHLKKRAVLWLLHRGAKDVRIERPYRAGRYDVAAEDLRIVVECGHTRVDKLLDCALSGAWMEFVVVPFVTQSYAVVFDLEMPRWRQVRLAVRGSHDPEMCMALLLKERRLTKAALARCIEDANAAFWRENASRDLGL